MSSVVRYQFILYTYLYYRSKHIRFIFHGLERIFHGVECIFQPMECTFQAVEYKTKATTNQL